MDIKYVYAFLILLPLLTMILPSLRYLEEFKKEKRTGESGYKAKYNAFFNIFVIGVLGMWVSWFGSIVSFVSGIDTSFPSWEYTSISENIIRLCGFIIFYIGAVIYNLNIIVAGKYLRPAPSGTLAHHILIAKGPFALIRHPLYVSYILITLGLGLILLNVLSFICVLLLALGIYPTAKAEESVLLMQLGDEYANYQKSVRMFFPKLRENK